MAWLACPVTPPLRGQARPSNGSKAGFVFVRLTPARPPAKSHGMKRVNRRYGDDAGHQRWKPWSDLDDEDLRTSVAAGDTSPNTAMFLCRSGTALEVADDVVPPRTAG